MFVGRDATWGFLETQHLRSSRLGLAQGQNIHLGGQNIRSRFGPSGSPDVGRIWLALYEFAPKSRRRSEPHDTYCVLELETEYAPIYFPLPLLRLFTAVSLVCMVLYTSSISSLVPTSGNHGSASQAVYVAHKT
jgi:hypothetical protein